MTFTVPGYQVDRLIGYGSHAEVWSGHVAGTAEAVALKRVILPAHGDPERVAELIRSARTEAALLTALEHPSLIRLRQYVQTPAAVVLVMELAEGGSLAQLLRRRNRLSPAEVSAALSPIAAALAFAHSEGVLHGDVSAANILFSAIGQPKLADLGVARMLIGHAGPERSLGTPAYVDPVVAAGGAAGTASDVFSLAAVALHCVSGTGPWHCGDPADLRAVLTRAATGVIDDLPGKLAGCPEAMAAVISRALDPEPQRRGSAAEFALDLGASVPSSPVVLAAGRIVAEVDRIVSAGDPIVADVDRPVAAADRPVADVDRPVGARIEPGTRRSARGVGRHSVERQLLERQFSGERQFGKGQFVERQFIERQVIERQGGGRQGGEAQGGEGQFGERQFGEGHGVQGHDRAGLVVVPADLTHVARLQVRPEPVEPSPQRRPLRWLADQAAGRVPGTLLITVGITVLAIAAVLGITALSKAAGRRIGQPSVAAVQPTALGQATADATQPAQPTALGQATADATQPAQPTALGQATAEASASTQPTAAAQSNGRAHTDRAGAAHPSPTVDRPLTPANPAAVLRQLADRRAEAFAGNRPDLLAGVYQSPALLAQDLSQLSSRVPAGCGLTGLHTTYRDITVTNVGPRRLELRVTASQPPASLVCAGTLRSRIEPAGPTRLVVRLVRVGSEFRIASQRPGP